MAACFKIVVSNLTARSKSRAGSVKKDTRTYPPCHAMMEIVGNFRKPDLAADHPENLVNHRCEVALNH